ncbi:anti-sigma factor domain-containing protein [Yoonia sp.]|uniref:anti-sigma factor n=1 Tax=Yoonia sp. TaxID=2212373 RepID=UPI00391A7B7C
MTAADDHNDDITLAGEYALHLMDAAERRAFEARLDAEPALRALVTEWNAQLIPLADDFAPQTPPASVKARVEAVLFPSAPKQSWSLWRVLVGSGFAAALAVVVLVMLPQDDAPAPFTPSLTAQIAAEDASLVVLASYAPETGLLRIDRQAGAAAEGRVLELWLIAEGADTPVSLGVLPDDAQTEIMLPDTLAPAISGGTLAISDEPLGGSPIGVPTGDVLAVGAVVSI